MLTWDPDADEPTVDYEDGASVFDADHRVTYYVTVGRGNGQVWIRSIEVEVERTGQRIDNAVLRRIPLATLAEHVALFLDRRALTRASIGAGRPKEGRLPLFGTIAPPGSIRLEGNEVPTTTELARMLRDGHTRATIAQHFERSPSTVSDWIRRAYREVPEQMPQKKKPGPKVKGTP